MGLSSFHQPIPKKIVDLRNSQNFGPSDLKIVLDPPKLDPHSVQNDVAAARIVVSGLPDATHVDHQLLVGQFVLIVDFLGRIKSTIFSEDARNVSMPLKAVMLDESEYSLDLTLVVHVFWEHVLVQWAAWRAMNEHQFFVTVGPRKLSQKIPASLGTLDRTIFQLISSPEDRLFGSAAEAVGIEQGSVVMVAQQSHVELDALVNALARIGAVPNHITQTKDFVDRLFTDIRKNRRERFKVTVNVADDCSFGQPNFRERDLAIAKHDVHHFRGDNP